MESVVVYKGYEYFGNKIFNQGYEFAFELKLC